MAKKKTETSKGVIRDLLARAWAKVKGKPRSERGTKADVEAKERKRIAEKTGRSEKQIKDIEKGKRPGKNLFEPLRRMKRGQKAEAPPKDEKKITRKKPEKPEKPPEEKPPEKAPRPKRAYVILRGYIGPFKKYDDSEGVRLRSIGQNSPLSAEQTARFYDAWESGDRAGAINYVVSEYYAVTGHPGYLESLTAEPKIIPVEGEE